MPAGVAILGLCVAMVVSSVALVARALLMRILMLDLGAWPVTRPILDVKVAAESVGMATTEHCGECSSASTTPVCFEFSMVALGPKYSPPVAVSSLSGTLPRRRLLRCKPTRR